MSHQECDAIARLAAARYERVSQMVCNTIQFTVGGVPVFGSESRSGAMGFDDARETIRQRLARPWNVQARVFSNRSVHCETQPNTTR